MISKRKLSSVYSWVKHVGTGESLVIRVWTLFTIGVREEIWGKVLGTDVTRDLPAGEVSESVMQN